MKICINGVILSALLIVQSICSMGEPCLEAAANFILRMSALHGAVCVGSSDLVKELLANKSDPDVKDVLGKTPMHYAAEIGDADVAIDIINQLVEHKASVLIEDKEGYRPQEWAVKPEVKSLFARYVDQELLAKCPERRNKKQEIILPETISLKFEQFDFTDVEREKTPLDDRLWSAKPSVIKSLLVSGQANPCGADKDGMTALHHLVLKGEVKKGVVDILVDLGADINARDYEGKTALYHGIANHRKTIKYLLARGADPFIPDSKGKVPAKEQFYKAVCDQVEKLALGSPQCSVRVETQNHKKMTIVIMPCCGDSDGKKKTCRPHKRARREVVQ